MPETLAGYLSLSQVAKLPGYEPPKLTHLESAAEYLALRGGLESPADSFVSDEMYSMKRARSARAYGNELEM